MDEKKEIKWYPIPEFTPQECRNVLLAIAHHADSFMRRFATGSWRFVNDKSVWVVDGMDSNFNDWGWYLVAWMPLPDFPEETK